MKNPAMPVRSRSLTSKTILNAPTSKRAFMVQSAKAINEGSKTPNPWGAKGVKRLIRQKREKPPTAVAHSIDCPTDLK